MTETTVYTIRTEDVRRLDPGRLAAAMPERAARAGRFRFEKDRLLCLGAGFLMTEALGIRNETEIRYGEFGKPFAPGYPAFSLSHSGERCILATGTAGTIGADLEEISEKHIDIAPEVYTGAELAWMAEDPLRRFFRLWTWKESVMKATGLGMQLEPRSFEVLPFAEGLPVRLLGRTWYACGGEYDGYGFSVCTDEPAGRVRWIEITPEKN